MMIVYTCVDRYHLTGPQQGKAEILIENLPGFPDNVRKSQGGKGYWVGLPICRNKESFALLDYILERPNLRGFLAKVIKDLFPFGQTFHALSLLF